jgi:alpha-tubulin suppressor-like RCC1 family protein
MLIFVLSLLTACGDEEPLAPDTEDPEVTENVGTFEPMSTGSSHTCGINTDHILYCWGCSHWGQLGGSREPPPDAHPSKAGSPSPR